MTGLINGIKGVFIGLALVIPGLSGSIFAVVVGLYDKILLAVSNIRKDFKRSCLFLLPIALGCIVGILASTKVVLWLCETYQLQAYSFFVGLVLGSVPLVVRKIKKGKLDAMGFAIAALSFAAIVAVGIFTKNVDEGTARITALTDVFAVAELFGTGLFVCALMMVPGVSGSVMLMLLGKYETIYQSVASAGDMLRCLMKGQTAEAFALFQNILVVVPFLIGALVGLALVAKLISFLLRKYESRVYYGVFGLVSGAVVSLAGTGVLPNFEGLSGVGSWMGSIIWIVAFVVIGWFCTTLLDVKEEKPATK